MSSPVSARVDAARDWFKEHGFDVTPHRVAEALRSTGRPVSDAEVLEIHEVLRAEEKRSNPDRTLLEEMETHHGWVSAVQSGKTLVGFRDWQEGKR